MNPHVPLVTAVAVVAMYSRVRRSKLTKKNRTLAHHNRALDEITNLLLEQCDHLSEQLSGQLKANAFLAHQNEYLVSMIDAHNVPVTEFDKIAMTYPLDAEE